jgi:antitoxin HicB
MFRYVYGFRCAREDGEVFFRFRRFPEIISAVGAGAFGKMNDETIEVHAHDAVIAALQSIIALHEEIPESDDPRRFAADGFVQLSVREAMKLELYRLYRANCKSVAEFARRLGKPETAARRLLDLRHHSRSAEIEAAVEAFGKQLVHDWGLEQAGHTYRPAHSSAK